MSAVVASVSPVVRVGVGCIKSLKYPGCVLVGTRKGSHGSGMLAFPGGHLEMNESWAECAIREVKEETNLDIIDLKFVHVTNDPCIAGNPDKHYVTIFTGAGIANDSAELQNLEPHKCESWNWMPWTEVIDVYNNSRERLFDPVIHMIEENISPI